MRSVMVILTLGLAACGGGVEGFWLGELDCGQAPYDLELNLAKADGKLTWSGEGVQQRVFDDASGNRTDTRIDFDASFVLESGSGAQVLDADMDCTDESQVLYQINDNGDPLDEGTVISEGCTPRRFVDYTVSWDGDARLDLSGPDGCEGFLIRK